MAQDGNYRIELRRWPEETGGAIRGKLDSKGKALDIIRANLQVQEFDQSVTVDNALKAARFDVPLKRGETEIVARFLTADGGELGAYFVTVTRQ